MHQQEDTNTNDWQACPPGTLTSLSTRLVRSRRRENIFKVAMLAAVVVVAIGAGRTFLRSNEAGQNQPMMYAGISCDDVRSQLPQWKTGKLDAPTSARIEAHLKLCGSCANLAKELQAERHRSTDAIVAAITPNLQNR